jgi:hypothetical protein
MPLLYRIRQILRTASCGRIRSVFRGLKVSTLEEYDKELQGLLWRFISSVPRILDIQGCWG